MSAASLSSPLSSLFFVEARQLPAQSSTSIFPDPVRRSARPPRRTWILPLAEVTLTEPSAPVASQPPRLCPP